MVSYTTASTCNAFFVTSNFIVREHGGFRPAEDLVEFARQLPWNENEAKKRLRSMMQGTWYAKELPVLFDVTPTMDEKELISRLGSTIGAREDQRGALQTLVRFVVYAGLVEQDADTGAMALGQGEAIVAQSPPAEVGVGATGPVVAIHGPSAAGPQVRLSIVVNLACDVSAGSPAEHAARIREVLAELGVTLS